MCPVAPVKGDALRDSLLGSIGTDWEKQNLFKGQSAVRTNYDIVNDSLADLHVTMTKHAKITVNSKCLLTRFYG